jgi:integrase
MLAPTVVKLYKRSNGVYYVVTKTSGKFRYISTGRTTKSGAIEHLPDLNISAMPRSEKVGLATFIAEYLRHVEAVKAKGTLRINRSILKSFLQFAGDAPLSKITPLLVDRFKAERLGKVSPVTLNIELRALRAAFNQAVRWSMIEGNPFTKVRLASVPEAIPRYFTKEDFQKLLSVIKEGWLRDVVIFAVLTGMRRGEILNLRWQDVDLGRRVVKIQSNETFKTKTGRRRTIPLGDVAYHLLQSRHRKSPSEYAFTVKDAPIGESWCSHRFKRYVDLAGLSGKGLHFHSLRHTFASWLVQDGVSIYEVQKLLGHSSIAVTQVYSHLQQESLHAAVNRLNLLQN